MIEVAHGFHDIPDVVCPDCGDPMRKLISSVRFAPSATPTRGEGTIDWDATKRNERAKDADMAAYRRLRRDGVQPPAINGSAALEAKAGTAHEVNSGHVFGSELRRRRGMGLVQDALDLMGKS